MNEYNLEEYIIEKQWNDYNKVIDFDKEEDLLGEKEEEEIEQSRNNGSKYK